MSRISAGKYKYKVILADEKATVPTKGMVKEAMMSMLGERIINATVLDLFAGSGALGLETLSRGAAHCLFVDNNPNAIKALKKNIANLGDTNNEVYLGDYLSALSLHKNEKFSIVFIDPPYMNKEAYTKSVSFLLENDMLTEDASIILEYEGEIEVDSSPFSFVKVYTYGRSKLTYLRK